MTETFLVAGEALVDLISEPGSWRFEATPGGSPLNVAVGLAGAGRPVRLATEVGDDLFGELIRGHLAHHRVDPVDLSVTATPTSLAFARLDARGVADYHFRLDWTWRGAPDLTGVAGLHVGSLGAVLEPGAGTVRELVERARRHGVPVSYDPNIRAALTGDVTGRVEELVAAADLVKVSDEDLARLYPDTPALTVARRWVAAGPRLVVVTHGGDGAVALTAGADRPLACAAPPVTVVDTVGAGDAFTAGLLSALADTPTGWERADVAAALRYATAFAAAVCGHRGAGPPSASAVADLLPATGPRAV